MAKRAAARAKTASPTQAAKPPDGIIAEHWSFYQLGQLADEAFREVGSKNAAARAIAREQKKGKQDVEKVLNFFQRYSVDELRRLGAIRLPSRGGRAGERNLSVNHLQRLSTVADPGMKELLLSGLEAERWSTERLDQEIGLLRKGPRRKGGRSVAKPGNLVEGLAQVHLQSTAWLRFHDAAWSSVAPWLDEAGASAASEGLAVRLQDARALLRRLRRAADLLEERLEGIERRLPRESGGTN